MGIDRIGRNGSPPPAPQPGGAAGAKPSGTAFVDPARASVTPPAAPPATGAKAAPSLLGVDGPAPSALDRLRAGAVDLGGYLDLKVDEATSHLSGLPPAELAAIRGALRERLATDPALTELVRAATGHSPQPDDD